MSMVFGEWRPEGTCAASNVPSIRNVLTRYAPDSFGKYETPELTILCCGLHATPESPKEVQPIVTRRGAILAWTGRLDNRADLINACGGALPADSSDVTIVASTYQRFGIECLSKLIGDWTVSIWEPQTRTLLLARDPIGSHPLYFAANQDSVRWSNALEALMLSIGTRLELNEAYIAGWLLSFPRTDLSPYREISPVRPGSLVRIYRGTVFVSRYWQFRADLRIRYRHDGEYEEHFLHLFRQAVARRLRARGPVLAELSGGVDSSSIVCVADHLRKQNSQEPTLETISYYDDTEPNWDERRNFSRIEELRGRPGIHVDCRENQASAFAYQTGRLAAIPASAARGSPEIQRALRELCDQQGCRVLLSGIGGDEVLGGVPTPYPELQDLLAGFHLAEFFRQLQRWSAVSRKPALSLVSGTVLRFLPGCWARSFAPFDVPCLQLDFQRRNSTAIEDQESGTRFRGKRPSFQENLETLTSLQRQLASQPLPQEPGYERRYPYLDRDLLEFIFAIPREQILRPGDRRSLMRRALVDMVPREVLFQKRKAAAVRGPVRAVAAAVGRMLGSGEPLEVARRGFIAPEQLAQAVAKLNSGESIQIVPVIRALALEGWLRNLCHHGVVAEASGKPPAPIASGCAKAESEPIGASRVLS